MQIVLIAIVACLASLLTFFSGFGLGTILTPVFVIFFPVEIAIALTGIVHLLTNFFKIALVFKHINWRIAIRFGVMAVIGAFAGAWLLVIIADGQVLYTYSIGSKLCSITIVKLSIALIMIVFTLFESFPRLTALQMDENKLPLGGLISGFFGGLSGNQGALRSMFLIKCGLSKESFIATGIGIACMVDLTRLSVYFSRLTSVPFSENVNVLIVAVMAAFAGAYSGNKLLKKVNLLFVQRTVSILIFLLALCLGSGFL